MASITSGTGPQIILGEIDAYRPATGAETISYIHGTVPHATLSITAQSGDVTVTIYASDVGWRSKTSDVIGLRAYPPLLESGFEIDRRINLSPTSNGVGAGWGSLRLRAAEGVAELAATTSPNGRGARIFAARKDWREQTRQFVDCPSADFANLFVGLAGNWVLSDTLLETSLRDATAWIERPVQTQVFPGTGGIHGPVTGELTNKPLPMVRGGVFSAPVRGISPVLVDPAFNIFRVSDYFVNVATLYEGGYSGGYTQAASVADLYATTCPAGQWRVGLAGSAHQGLLQIGGNPARSITVDAYGGTFANGLSPSSLALCIKEFLLQDLLLPPEHIDAADWTALNIAYGWGGGWWLGTEAKDGADHLSYLINSLGARIVPARDGTLRPVVLRAISSEPAEASWTADHILSLRPLSPGAPLSPPPAVWRVGHSRNHTVQTTDLSPLTTAARKATIREEYAITTVTSPAAAALHRRPGDAGVIPTALTAAVNSTLLANALSALWSDTPQQLLSVVLPVHLALGVDLGSVVSVSYPGPFSGGVRCRVVAESLRGGDKTATLTLLAPLSP